MGVNWAVIAVLIVWSLLAMADAQYDILVIGGGIVGLSVALEITRRFPGLRLLLVEKEDRVAAHQSGHNSGVIHSGVYYKPGSLKARMCVQGAAEMVRFCQQHQIPYEVCGKVIVATAPDQLSRLEDLAQRGQQNGIAGLRMIGPGELHDREPHCAGIQALLVPSTGITDYAAVCRKYASLIEQGGGAVRTGAAVTGIVRSQSAIQVETSQGGFSTVNLVNCAGLYSDRISRMAGESPPVMIVPFRGEYYDLVPQRASLVRALIYPVADPRFPFLGVHFTRRVSGTVDAGPNAVLAFRREGYRRWDIHAGEMLSTLAYPGFWRMAGRYWRSGFDEFARSLSKKKFVAALQQLVPEVAEADLVPGNAGVRAQALTPEGTLFDDFQFTAAGRVLHVFNVPSPAATASLPIGRAIVDLAARAFALPPAGQSIPHGA